MRTTRSTTRFGKRSATESSTALESPNARHDPDEDLWMNTGEDPKATEHLRRAVEDCYPVMAQLRHERKVSLVGVAMNQWHLPQGMIEQVDVDVVLLAGRYTLLDQSAVDSFLPLCIERNVSVIIGAPYNSGILATGSRGGGYYDYARPSPSVVERVQRIETACADHDVDMRAAALQFPLAHPSVISVIPGASSAREVRKNCELLMEPIPSRFWDRLREGALIDSACPVPA